MQFKVRIYTICFLLSLSMSGPAISQNFENGNDLRRHCQSTDQIDVFACRSFIMGVINGMMLGSLYVDTQVRGTEITKGYSPLLPFCFPHSVLISQLADVVVRFNEVEQVYGDEPPGGIVVRALRKAYPCD